ncbi:MAG: hypothetical protein KIT02_10320 [Devosia sp.]|uniref:hypothetical protein n=1 Tax=Devosia sp. TaxID=1871048 RepID=UPI0024CBD335|nr:hypothetical protein [Devosia sp.]UYN98361.1 MAG: hypothetical protein KIT02_10320 [Devosia sp.]
MPKKKDTVLTVAVGGAIPAGHVLLLTAAQAGARRHLLTSDSKDSDPWHWKGDGRHAFTTVSPTYFKTGEELGVDGSLDRGLEIMFGLAGEGAETKPTPSTQEGNASKAELEKAFNDGKAAGAAEVGLDKKLAEAKQAGRAEMLAEVERRNGLFDALETAQVAQEALTSDADEDARAAAQRAVDSAQAKVDALPELKA